MLYRKIVWRTNDKSVLDATPSYLLYPHLTHNKMQTQIDSAFPSIRAQSAESILLWNICDKHAKAVWFVRKGKGLQEVGPTNHGPIVIVNFIPIMEAQKSEGWAGLLRHSPKQRDCCRFLFGHAVARVSRVCVSFYFVEPDLRLFPIA